MPPHRQRSSFRGVEEVKNFGTPDSAVTSGKESIFSAKNTEKNAVDRSFVVTFMLLLWLLLCTSKRSIVTRGDHFSICADKDRKFLMIEYEKTERIKKVNWIKNLDRVFETQYLRILSSLLTPNKAILNKGSFTLFDSKYENKQI